MSHHTNDHFETSEAETVHPSEVRSGAVPDGSHAVDASTDRSRFAGAAVPGALVGALTIFGLLAVPGVLTGGIANFFYVGEGDGALSAGAFLGALLIFAAAMFVGGWTAARIARADGAFSGALTGALFLLFSMAAAYVATNVAESYGTVGEIAQPAYLATPGTAGWILASLAFLLCGIVGSTLGGVTGERSLAYTPSRARVATRTPVHTGATSFSRTRTGGRVGA